MNKGKKRSVSHILGEEAVKILKNMFPSEWVSREISPDYGLDMAVELFEPFEKSYVSTGEHIYFQVKGIKKPKICKLRVYARTNVEKEYKKNEKKYYEIDVLKFSLDTPLLRTVEKMGSAVPVLLVVVDINISTAYYICLNDYIEKVLIPDKQDYDMQKTITINIPIDNVIHNKKDIIPIEWYAKRSKLYALFNKVNYQKEELKYLDDVTLLEKVMHFATILSRLDAWKASKYFYALKVVEDNLEYFKKNKITIDADKMVYSMKNRGEDLISPIWTTNSCDAVSLEVATVASSLRKLWDSICNCGNLLEDFAKEWFLPTPIGITSRV